MAVQDKYDSLKKPADKQEFTIKISKSYKDMLSALKENFTEEKETILDRIDKKLQERKNG